MADMYRGIRIGLALAGGWALSAPVMAGTVVQELSEPGTIGLVAGGIAAAVIVARLRKRK